MKLKALLLTITLFVAAPALAQSLPPTHLTPAADGPDPRGAVQMAETGGGWTYNLTLFFQQAVGGPFDRAQGTLTLNNGDAHGSITVNGCKETLSGSSISYPWWNAVVYKYIMVGHANLVLSDCQGAPVNRIWLQFSAQGDVTDCDLPLWKGQLYCTEHLNVLEKQSYIMDAPSGGTEIGPVYGTMNINDAE